jgi:hypothetical protein
MTPTKYYSVPTRKYVERAGVCLGLSVGGLALIHGWKLFGPVPDAASGIGFTLLFIGAIASVINVAGLFYFTRQAKKEAHVEWWEEEHTYLPSMIHLLPNPGLSPGPGSRKCLKCNNQHRTPQAALQWHQARRTWMGKQPSTTLVFGIPITRYMRTEDQFIEGLRLALGVGDGEPE